MGLVIKTKVKEIGTGTSVQMYDLTQLYNDPDNLGGFGSPNPATAGALVDQMIITPPDPTTLLPTQPPITVPFTSTTNKDAFTTVLPSDLGFTTQFPDGVYIFNRIFVDAGSEEYQTYQYIVLSGQVECCLQNLALQAKTGNSGCSCTEEINQLILDKILFTNAFCTAKGCGDLNNTVKYLKQLQLICDKLSCCIN